MSFVDSMQALLDKVKQRNWNGQEEQITSNMANGGFSGYKPATAKHRAMNETRKQQSVQNMPEQQMGYDMGGMPQQTGYNYTGMQGGQTGFQPMGDPMMGTGYQQPMQSAGYQPQQPQNATGYQSAFGANWQQAQPMDFQPQQNGYQPQDAGFQPQQTGYQPQQTGFQSMDPMGYQNGYGMDQGYQQGGMEQNYQQTPDNISYMPGNFVGNDGRAYSHVERVAQLTRAAACYRIIEFMRNGESVIVNTEAITDERENQRCLDMLYGAAFVMQCTMTRISEKKDIYLFSPATVMVVPYDSIRRMSDQDMSQRWPDPDQAEDRYGYGERRREQTSFRERREAGRRSGYTDRYDTSYGSYDRGYGAYASAR